MKKDKIAIIGKDSFLGKHLFRFFSEKDEFEVLGTSFKDLDITKEDQIHNFLEKNKPDSVILLAGSKDVKALEQDEDFAQRINVLPPKYFVQGIKKLNLKTTFFFMSSDYVFDGAIGNYKDTDITCPTTVYGKNKETVENYLKQSGINYKIIRTAAVLGEGSVFLSWLLDELKNDTDVEMFSNSYFSPTCISFLCEAFEKIITKNPPENILHVTHGQRLSRYELAKLVQSIIRTSKCEILPFETKEKDLSLIPSDFILAQNFASFEEYLQKDTNCL